MRNTYNSRSALRRFWYQLTGPCNRTGGKFTCPSVKTLVDHATYLRVRSFGMICIRTSDPRSLGSWSIKGYQRRPEWIHRFLRCVMIRVILDHWSIAARTVGAVAYARLSGHLPGPRVRKPQRDIHLKLLLPTATFIFGRDRWVKNGPILNVPN